MLHIKTGLLIVVSVLIGISACLVAMPRASALPGSAHQSRMVVSRQQRLVLARGDVANGGICKYSADTSVIIDFRKWSSTVSFCGAGFFAREIDQVNDIYDNGGGPMWVKWSVGRDEHFCSISGPGAYWEFDRPVKITQINYGSTHDKSYCH